VAYNSTVIGEGVCKKKVYKKVKYGGKEKGRVEEKSHSKRGKKSVSQKNEGSVWRGHRGQFENGTYRGEYRKKKGKIKREGFPMVGIPRCIARSAQREDRQAEMPGKKAEELGRSWTF